MHAAMKLGKRPFRPDPRTLRLSVYLPTDIPVPAACDWSIRVPSWTMLGNDTVGDCVEAAALNAMRVWSSWATGSPSSFSTNDALTTYTDLTGYTPSDSSTDRGTVMLDTMKTWRSDGLLGHRIEGFTYVDWHNRNHIKAAIKYFGAMPVGLALPTSAQTQPEWNLTDPGQGDQTPGSWGGHAVAVVGYSDRGLMCVTWAQIKWMTWDWVDKYMDEAWAVLAYDWQRGGPAPSDIAFNALRADLTKIGTLQG